MRYGHGELEFFSMSNLFSCHNRWSVVCFLPSALRCLNCNSMWTKFIGNLFSSKLWHLMVYTGILDENNFKTKENVCFPCGLIFC